MLSNTVTYANQQKLNILYWNANGISKHIHEFYNFLDTFHIHAACISETFLKSHIKLLSHPDFMIHRFDRADRPKGGVAIFIRRNIKHTVLPHIDTKLCEAISVEILLENGSKIHLTSVYMPGGTKNTPISAYFGNDIQKLTTNTTSYFVCGDLNARHRHWNCLRANQAGSILYKEYCDSNFLINFPSTHTRVPFDTRTNPSTIDLVLTNGLHSMSEPECHTTSSDHNAITFTINMDNKVVRNVERLSYDYENANWDVYRGIIHYHISTNSLNITEIENIEQIEQHIEKFQKLIEHARDRAVPLTFHHRYKLCIPDELKKSIKIKNSMRKIWQRTRNSILKTIVNQMEKEIKNAINKIRNDNWQLKLSNIKPSNQSVWSTARMLKNSNRTIPPLKEDGKFMITAHEKANTIASQFKKNHENPLKDTDAQFSCEVDEKVYNFFNDTSNEFSCTDYADEDELINEIKKLKNKKSPGTDKIKNTLIKKLPSRGIAYMLFIINACLKFSYFPDRWKEAKVTPILKPSKDPTITTSYRPISLLCAFSKILERIILNRINKFLEEHNVIPEEQHGFKKKFSTTHQLTKMVHKTKNGLKDKCSTGIIMLDVEKAFDRVWHNGLIFKMIALKFPPYIINMINNFLKNRKFFVEINNAKSPVHDIPFGVPQGAVLSPTLYNIFTHDIPKSINTTLALFADDTAFYCSSPIAKTIVNALKEHAQLISDYMKKWKINLNNSKTQTLFITNRRKKELPGKRIKIFNQLIPWQTESKYLGFVLEKRMTFQKHINYVIARANVAVKTLYPLISRKSKLHLSNKLLIYKLAIRPIFTYACPAFINIAECHIKKLQQFQNKVLKMILNRRRNERTETVHKEANVPLIKDYIRKLTTKFNDQQNQ